MVTEEIIGLSIGKKNDGMSLLLQVMAKMDAPGGMPQPLATNDKQYPHFFWFLHVHGAGFFGIWVTRPKKVYPV
jgi:hypothetical protein